MLTQLRSQRGTLSGRILVAGVLGLLLPILAQATSINLVSCAPGQVCIQNQGGSATTNGGGSNPTFSLSGATVISIGTAIQPPGSTLDFTTGTLASGTLGGGGTFNGGGSFVVNGTYAGFTGAIFTGSFSGPVTWQVVGVCTKTISCTYNLVGAISGTWYNGETVFGATTQLFFKTTKGPYAGGSITPEDGSTFVVTPEPNSLAFMGTGLLGMGLVLRCRLRRKS